MKKGLILHILLWVLAAQGPLRGADNPPASQEAGEEKYQLTVQHQDKGIVTLVQREGSTLHLKAQIQDKGMVMLTWTDDSPLKPQGYECYYSVGPRRLNPPWYRVGSFVLSGDSLQLQCGGARHFFFKIRPVTRIDPLVEGPESDLVNLVFKEAYPTDQFNKADRQIQPSMEDGKLVLVRPVSGASTPLPTPTPLFVGLGPTSYSINLGPHAGMKVKVCIQNGGPAYSAGKNILRTIVDGNIPDDQEAVTWDGRGADGKPLPDGRYGIWIYMEGQGKESNSMMTIQIPFPTPNPQ